MIGLSCKLTKQREIKQAWNIQEISVNPDSFTYPKDWIGTISLFSLLPCCFCRFPGCVPYFPSLRRGLGVVLRAGHHSGCVRHPWDKFLCLRPPSLFLRQNRVLSANAFGCTYGGTAYPKQWRYFYISLTSVGRYFQLLTSSKWLAPSKCLLEVRIVPVPAPKRHIWFYKFSFTSIYCRSLVLSHFIMPWIYPHQSVELLKANFSLC